MTPQWQVRHGHFWRDLPKEISNAIEAERSSGCEECVYTRDWGASYSTNCLDPITNEPRTPSRYLMDVINMMQRNLDTDNALELRFVYLEE